MPKASLTDKQLTGSVLSGLLSGKDLSASTACKLFEMLFTGRLSDAQAKSVLLLLAKKGETAEELWGAVHALKRLEKPLPCSIRGLMDTCGTGGDKSQSINISTLAAFIVAGAGIKVAKHGNRAISSRSGSSDLMESLGIKIDAGAPRMLRAIKRAGIGYFHAPFYHPVFARLHPLRQSLKRRTILNLLGPLVNPLNLDYQLVGVGERRLLPLYAKVLAKLNRRSAVVCHSADGMDEISTSNPTHVAWINHKKLRFGTLRPGKLGLRPASRSALRVSDPAHGHRIARNILAGSEKGPRRDAVILNAACALYISGKAGSLKAGVAMARKSLESGRAFQSLTTLKKIASGS